MPTDLRIVIALMDRVSYTSSMAQPHIALPRNTRNIPRRDYVALNNGLNALVSTPPLDVPHDDESREPSDTINSVESNSLTPFESASQVSTSSPPGHPSSDVSTGTRPTATPARCYVATRVFIFVKCFVSLRKLSADTYMVPL